MIHHQGHVLFLLVDIHIPMSHSLKMKRRVIKSLKDKIRARFSASVAEIGDPEKWQRAVLGISIVNNDKTYLASAKQSILNIIETSYEAEILQSDVEFFK